MTEYSRPFYMESGGVPTGYDEVQTREYFKGVMRKDGYTNGYLSELAVIQNTPAAMNVIVGTGSAWVQGGWYLNDAAKTMTIAAADGANPRIDRVVVRLTVSSPTSGIALAVLTGTPAAVPSAPALTRSATVWEISIAKIAVAAGAGSILTANITDERNDDSVCGIATPSLGEFFIETSGNLNANSFRIKDLKDPSDNQDADTKAARDAAITAAIGNGGQWKQPVRAATTVTGALISAYDNASVIDGVTLATGDRILIKNQTDGSQNGIYIVPASGTPTRATDFDTGAEIFAASVQVQEGTVNGGSAWRCTNLATPTINVTALTFGRYYIDPVGINSISGNVQCDSAGMISTETARMWGIVKRAGVYSFRTHNGTGVSFGDESAKYITVSVNSTTENLEGCNTTNYGPSHSLTLAVGDVVFLLIGTIAARIMVQIRNQDGIGPF